MTLKRLKMRMKSHPATDWGIGGHGCEGSWLTRKHQGTKVFVLQSSKQPQKASPLRNLVPPCETSSVFATAQSLHPKAAFSLIELLVVIGIIALLAGLSLPAFNSMSKSVSLESSAAKIMEQLNLAKQTAINQNRSVEVRFYKPNRHSELTTSPAIRILLIKGYKTDGTLDLRDISKIQYLDNGVEFHDDPTYSSIFATGPGMAFAGPGETLPGTKTEFEYHSFEFKPNGRTSLDSSQHHFITLQLKNAPRSGTVPGLAANFITIEINPVTGKTRQFRP